MRLQISARRCEIPDALRDRAERRLRKLKRYHPRLASAEVIFTEERHMKRAEGILSIEGDEPIVANGEATDFLPALERMTDKLDRAIRRRRAQVRDHKGRGPGLKWGLDGDS